MPNFLRLMATNSKWKPILSDMLKTNKTIKRILLQFSTLTGGIKQISESLFNNKTLQELVLYKNNCDVPEGVVELD